MSSKLNLTCNVCLEAGFAENDFVNATKKNTKNKDTSTRPRTFPQRPGPGSGPECQGPGQRQGHELQGPGPGL